MENKTYKITPQEKNYFEDSASKMNSKYKINCSPYFAIESYIKMREKGYSQAKANDYANSIMKAVSSFSNTEKAFSYYQEALNELEEKTFGKFLTKELRALSQTPHQAPICIRMRYKPYLPSDPEALAAFREAKERNENCNSADSYESSFAEAYESGMNRALEERLSI